MKLLPHFHCCWKLRTTLATLLLKFLFNVFFYLKFFFQFFGKNKNSKLTDSFLYFSNWNFTNPKNEIKRKNDIHFISSLRKKREPSFFVFRFTNKLIQKIRKTKIYFRFGFYSQRQNPFWSVFVSTTLT